MKIRLAFALDSARLAELETLQPMSAHWGEKGFAGEINTAAARVWCWEEDEELWGFVALRLAAGFCEILNVAVHPQKCRQGIGFALLSHALKDVQQQGGKTVTLEVNEHNRPALALYTKAGLKILGRRKKFYDNKDDALIMGTSL